MTVIKRDRSTSTKDLIDAVEQFADLLQSQSEDDAIADLKGAADQLKKTSLGTPEHRSAVGTIIDAFEGDHELNAYIMQKPSGGDWTEADELSQTATRVLNLAKRLRS